MLVSCSNGGDSTSGATVPRATTTTDPYAVPATIDIAYLNRVFVALEKINGDATRLIVANRRITPEAAVLLHSILTDDEFKIQADIWNDYIDQGLPGIRAVPGDRITTVNRIIHAAPECIAAEVTRDYDAVRRDAKDAGVTKLSLSTRTVVPPNPSPWAVSREGTVKGDAACAA